MIVSTADRLRASLAASYCKENVMKRIIALGLAMLAGAVVGGIAFNGRQAQNKASGAYAMLDLGAINSATVLKTLPSKTGDFDGHTA
jgi:hypothetical protein